MTEQNTNVENTVETNEIEATEVLQAISQVNGFVTYKFPSQEVADSVKASLTEDVLLKHVFKLCGTFDAVKKGFVAFQGEGDNMLLQGASSTMFQVMTQKKVPHPALVKKNCKIAEAKYKVDNAIEKLDSDTKKIIKMEVVEALIPTTTANEPESVLLWLTGDMLIVGTSTYKKAEDYIDMVRFAVDTCPVQSLEFETEVQDTLTKLLSTQYCENIVMMDLVHLEHPTEKGIVKFEKASLYDIECKKHLQEDCVVNKIQLSNEERCTFTLNKDFECSGVKIAKDVLSGTKDLGALIITVDEINGTVKELVEVFGGEVNEEA